MNFKKILSLRSALCLALALFMAFASIGCKDKPVDKGNDIISSQPSNNSSDDISSDDVSSDDVSSEDNSLEDDNTSENITIYDPNKDNSKVEQSTQQTNPSSKPTATTVTSEVEVTNKKSDFVLDLLQYHPGVPGYDVEYQFTAKYKDKPLNADAYTLSTNLEGVKIEGNKVIVPESIRETGKTLIVTAKFNGDATFTSKVAIRLKAWKQTWADEFNVDGDRSNWSHFYMTRTKDENAYVKDGCLNLVTRADDFEVDGKTWHASSGYVSTDNVYSQVYGCFRAKVRLQDGCYEAGGGVLDTFWLIPDTPYTTTYFYDHPTAPTYQGCSEMDIFETHALGVENSISSSQHFWDENGENLNKYGGLSVKGTIPASYYTKGKWYDVSYVWTPYALYTYVDGMLNGALDNIVPTADPAPAIIIFGSLAATPGAPDWFGEMKSMDYLTTPQEYKIDFVRTYQ